MPYEPTPEQTVKHVLLSILIGACVSFLTVLLQGLLGVLQNLPPEFVGGLAGATKYLHAWKLHHLV